MDTKDLRLSSLILSARLDSRAQDRLGMKSQVKMIIHIAELQVKVKVRQN